MARATLGGIIDPDPTPDEPDTPRKTGHLTREEPLLAKPEWGSKRICPSCGTRYYDLLRDPVICPKCATPFDADAFLRSRRARPAPPIEKELEPVGADEIDAELETEEADAAEEEEEAVPHEETEEEDEELL